MAWYSFTGNNSLGRPIQGEYKIRADADAELLLISRLQSAGITAASIKKVPFFSACLIELKRFAGRCFPVKKSDLFIFYYQLADMMEVGIPLKQALMVIAAHFNNPRLARVIHDVVGDLSKGATFAEALGRHKRLFPAVILRLISFAQSKEELTAILRYCDQSMRRMSFLQKVLFVTIPQCSIMVVLFMVLFFLRERYLPSFNYAIFVFKNPVPLVIHVFEFLTGLFTVNLFKTLASILGVVVGFKLLVYFSKKTRFLYHAFLFYFPVISGVILALERERLALLYSILLKGGASTQKCAQCGIAVIGNLFFQRRVKAMSRAVQRGEEFSNTLRYFRIFGSAEVQMIALGAISASLIKTFERIYTVSQIILERKLLLLLEFLRLGLYLWNSLFFFFTIFVAETLFFYPGAH
ncbi:MAG: type II secretion system F family protein [Pseudomonadota bacterium]